MKKRNRIPSHILSVLIVFIFKLTPSTSAFAISSSIPGLGDLYTPVGFIGLNNNNPYASGTLISSQWVLTAGHVVDGYISNGGDFYLNGANYAIDASFSAPGHINGSLEADIGLFRLTDHVATNEFPTLYWIDEFTETDIGIEQLGETATLVGYGETSLSGAGGTGDGSRRAGTNTVAFDNLDLNIGDPLRSQPLFGVDSADGAATGPGDSGGSVWYDFGNGEVLVGVHSFGSFYGGGNWSSWAYEVSPYMGWISSYAIDSVWGVAAGSFNPGGNGTGNPVPLPATVYLLGTGLAGLIFKRLRNNRQSFLKNCISNRS